MDRRQFLALSTIGALAGCSGSGSSSDSNSNSSTTTTAPEATESGSGSAASVGETVTSRTGIEITATDAQLVSEAMTPDGELVPEASNHRLALVRIESKNTADEPRDLPMPNEIVMVTGGQQFPAEVDFGFSGDTYTRLSDPVSGSFYEGVSEARPTVTSSGWLIFEVPTNTESGRVSWTRETFTDEVEEVTLSAEWTVPFNPEQLPNVQVDSVDAPSSALHHTEVNVIVKLTNTGGTEGKFEGRVASEELSESIPVTATVPAGSETTVSVSVPYPSPTWGGEEEERTVTYHLGRRSFSISYRNPTLDIGESVQAPWGISMTVLDARRIDYIEVESPLEDWRTREPDAGEQFIAFRVQIRNTGETSAQDVSDGDFNMASDSGEIHNSLVINGFDSKRIRGPINGETLVAPDPLPAGDSYTGWVILTVPSDLPANIFLRYAPSLSDYSQFHPRWRV